MSLLLLHTVCPLLILLSQLISKRNAIVLALHLLVDGLVRRPVLEGASVRAGLLLHVQHLHPVVVNALVEARASHPIVSPNSGRSPPRVEIIHYLCLEHDRIVGV